MKESSNKQNLKLVNCSVLLSMITVLQFTFAFASENLIRVQADVDKSVITIGDRVTYTLTIEHDKKLHIEQPGPGANLGQFEIKDYRIEEPLQKDNIISQQFKYEISVFDTGKFVIPPFPVAFSESDTSRKYQFIQSEPLEIYVKSVLTAENAEIRDIKPPQSIPFNYKRLILYGVVVLLVVGGIILTIYIFQRRKKGLPLFRKEVIRPAHEIALEELANLKSKWVKLLEQGEHKSLFTDISNILRRYLENRFFIKALEETTYEISESIKELELSDDQERRMLDVLEFSDLVKFAKQIPEKEETSAIINKLEEFIERSKLIFETVENMIPVTESEATNIETETEVVTDK